MASHQPISNGENKMIIPINKKWRIHSTSHCWQVEKFRRLNGKGEEVWEPKTFHTTLGGAAQCVFDEQVRRVPDQKNVKQILKKISEIRNEVKTALLGFGGVG